jgi:hypothetical protein
LEKNDVRYRFVVDVKGSKIEEWMSIQNKKHTISWRVCGQVDY